MDCSPLNPAANFTSAIHRKDHSAIYIYHYHFLNWNIPVLSLHQGKLFSVALMLYII